MNKQTQEALKMAIEQAIIEFEVLSSFPQYDLDYVDMIKELRGCLEALEQPAQSITEGATMFKQVGNSPKPPAPPPIHICTYSKTMNQEYPRKCIHCGKVEALEQPAQEPVVFSASDLAMFQDNAERYDLITSLHAPAKEWQGLTDDEVAELLISKGETSMKYIDFFHAIEQALKEKNSG